MTYEEISRTMKPLSAWTLNALISAPNPRMFTGRKHLCYVSHDPSAVLIHITHCSLNYVPEKNYDPEDHNVRIDASSRVDDQAAKSSHDNKKSLEDTTWGADKRTDCLLIPLFARKKLSRICGLCFAGESSISIEFGNLVELSGRGGRRLCQVVEYFDMPLSFVD